MCSRWSIDQGVEIRKATCCEPRGYLPLLRLRPAGDAGAVSGVRDSGGGEGSDHLMRRLLRILFNGLTVLSLVLAVLVAGLWIGKKTVYVPSAPDAPVTNASHLLSVQPQGVL